MFLRPTTSDVDDQANRPAMLNSDSTPDEPGRRGRRDRRGVALAEEVHDHRRRLLEDADAGGDVAEQHRHSSQNCGVLMAFAADTLALVTSGFSSMECGSKPSGSQPSGGTRISQAPNSITTR